MKGIAAFLSLILLFSYFANAAVIEQLYWEPEHPKPGEDITVYAKISGNISKVCLQYCIGEACFPVEMKKEGDMWTYTINGNDVHEGKIDVNITVEDDMGHKVYMEKEIDVKKGGNAPGFGFAMLGMAIIAIFLAKIKSGKQIR